MYSHSRGSLPLNYRQKAFIKQGGRQARKDHQSTTPPSSQILASSKVTGGLCCLRGEWGQKMREAQPAFTVFAPFGNMREAAVRREGGITDIWLVSYTAQPLPMSKHDSGWPQQHQIFFSTSGPEKMTQWEGGRDPPHTPCPCVLFPALGGRMCHTAQRHARETWKRIFGFVESAGQRAAPLLAEEAQRTIYMLVLFYEFLYLNWVLWLKSETKASSQKNPFCSFCTSGEKVCLWALFKAWTFFEERKTRNKQGKKNQTNHHAHTTKKRSLEKEHVCPNCTHVHAHTHTHAHTQKQRPKGSKLWSLWSIYKMRKGSQKKKEKEDRVKCTRVTDMYTP